MSLGFLPRYDTNRGLYRHKRWLMAETVRYFASRENVPTVEQNRGAEQLHCYWAADLCLCFTE